MRGVIKDFRIRGTKDVVNNGLPHGGEVRMYVERESYLGKALLMNKDGVSFWIQRRWLKGDSVNGFDLTPAGWKAYYIAAREHARHLNFEALTEFEFVKDTEKAVLLRCVVVHPDGTKTKSEFWLPKSMTGNWKFVQAKIKEIEDGFPFKGTYVVWSGAEGKESKK